LNAGPNTNFRKFFPIKRPVPRRNAKSTFTTVGFTLMKTDSLK